MASFSVKKPFTVLVAVVAILVLGFVSFTSMTPDLLPSMELPYVLLITTYPGASPERVETTVTKPLEQAMATLENIENISSTSSENASTIFLEFSSDVNMESITVDILQKVSQVQGYWDDMVSTPLILKLNPDMLPVMVAAVEMEGMETTALSTFTSDTLMNRLEGISGVASVSASGLVEETVNVVLRQDKIDEVNRRIAAAIGDEFAAAEQELVDTQRELEGKLHDIDVAIVKLEDGIGQLAGQMGAGATETEKKQMELLEGKLALQQVLQETISQRAQLANLQQVLPLLQYLPGVTTLLSSEAAILDAALPGWQQMGADELRAAVAGLAATDPTYLGFLAMANPVAQLMGLPAWDRLAVQAMLAAVDQNEIINTLALLGIPLDPTSQSSIDAAVAALGGMIAQADAGIATMEDNLKKLESGEIALTQAMGEMQRIQISTQYELGAGSAQLTMADTQLTLALDQIESGLEQLRDARADAIAAADLNKILTMDMISGILRAQNFSMPAGYVSQDGVDYLVRVGDEIANLSEMQGLMLLDMGLDDVAPVHLRDVADVFIQSNRDTLYAKINGADGVLLTFNKQSTYATADVTGNITDKFDELAGQFPGLRFTSLMDQGDYIYIVVNSILQNLAMGAVFAIIILFLFLKDLRPTFITLCSIPISVVFAITLMYFSGVTLNIISLSGLAVAVGMLVDNSVVVIENIFRLRNKGVPAVKAAVTGAGQVAGALVSSTLTTICVFAPIVFVQGLTRDLFTDMALTLAYALLASLIVAMTLVPAMSAGMFRNMQPKQNKLLDKMLGVYDKSLGWALGHKAIMLVAVVVLLAGSAAGVLARGFSFMPDMDMPQLTVTLEMPEDSTFEDLKKSSDELIARIEGIDGVETVGAIADSSNLLGSIMGMGGGGGSDEAATSVTMYVMLQESGRISGSEVGAQIEEISKDIPGKVDVSSSSMMSISALGGSGISVRVYGDNTDELFAAARQVAATLQGVGGTTNVRNGIGETDPELRFVVDKDKAMAEGLTVAQVYSEVSRALSTEASSASVTWEGESYDVLIVKGGEQSLSPAYIKNLRFTVTNRAGEENTIALRDIAEIIETETATSIQRDQQRRYLTVSAGVTEGNNVSLVAQEAERALRAESLPTGTSYEMAGENETIMDAFVELGKMLLLGILLVYLIMVAQFQSLKSPFIVMFTIPLAFTGGFLALFVTGMELSVIALIGFIMLVGIIVNNGIVLVDYINQLRLEGTERVAAIKEAGNTRMRPILMTSLTTILGLFTMALGMGTGAELMQPVAIVSIGGLAYATLMTLYIVPIIYDMLNKKELKKIDDADLQVDESL